MKRLVVVADNSLIVEAIRIGLRQRGDFELLGHISGRTTPVSEIIEAAPDVVLVDDMDQSEEAIELIREITTANKAIAMIALTFDMDPVWLDAVFDAGATAAISKVTHPVALSTLIRETVEGHVFHVRTRSQATREIGPQRVVAKDSSLTTREIEVLRLVAAGSTNGEIARVLWVTEQTVKFHLSNVYKKLDVGNRTQASHYAHVNGLLGTAPALVAS
jgi:DNA-binding NarL/FixJ family response regulator